MMKPKRWEKRRISRPNTQRGARIATMGRSRGDCMDTRNYSWIPTLSECWSILLPMLLPRGGWTLNMMSIHSIGWSKRAVYPSLFLTIKYRISWLGTCKVRNLIQVALLVSWKNHVLNKIWRKFSIFHPDQLHIRCHFPKEVEE